MSSVRYATSRQKSCQQCSKAKARCDRNADGCSRCARRNLRCTYSQPRVSAQSHRSKDVEYDSNFHTSPPMSHDLSASETVLSTSDQTSPNTLDNHDDISPRSLDIDSTIPATESSASVTINYSELDCTPLKTAGNLADEDTINFGQVTLICPINADDISNRWLNQYVPLPGQAVKNYPASVTSFIYRILNSYTAVVIHGRGVPPFVHSLQTSVLTICPPLSSCLSLARICEQQLPGATAVSIAVLQREMDKLYEQHKLCDDTTLLATFQAYLIYAMIIFFRLSRDSNQFLRQAMVNLQELACTSCKRGLLCLSEQQGTRPEWESWIVAESKRRTLYTMYLFDSVLSTQDNLPTFLGTELRGLPAPTSRVMWQASSRVEWQRLYNVHLSAWSDGFFRIDELWPADPDVDADLVQKADRTNLWLENLDEFGTMLYAVTSCTHGP